VQWLRRGADQRAGNRVEARQVFDLPPLRLGVVEHRAERRLCACGATTAGVFPAQARAAACYGPGLWAPVCYLCVHQHLPVDRAAQLLADVLGAPVATGTLAAMVAEGAAGLGGCVEVGRARLAAAPVAPFDETGTRVAGRLHWVHWASTTLLSLFSVHAKRGKVAMDAAGVLPGSLGSRCTTAGRRIDAPRSPTRCAARTCSGSSTRSPMSQGRVGRWAWPSSWSMPSWSPTGPASLALTASTSKPGPRCILRLLAERDLRMVKLQQRISGCWRTLAGAAAFLVLRSYVSTARKQGINPLVVLRQLFEARPFLPTTTAS
jgi:transposase